MSWQKITLTNSQIEEQQVLKEIEKQFEQLYMAADGPSDMAILSDNEYDGDKINIYFTPGCSPACDELISSHQGEPCEPPSIDHVFLFTGNDDALDLLS